jgi:predicted GIY-YIG superfamily endonuclease
MSNSTIKNKWVYLIRQKSDNKVVYVGESYTPIQRFYKYGSKYKVSTKDLVLEYVQEFEDRKDALTKERELKLLYGLEHTESTRAHHLATPKPLLVFKDGELIGEYYAIQQAVRTLKLIKCDVYHCLAGRVKQHKGYTFQYKV